MTIAEEQFLTFIFLHITCSFELLKVKEITDISALQADISDLMQSKNLQKFWSEHKKYYNKDFIKFIDECKN